MKAALTVYKQTCKSYDKSVDVLMHNGVAFKTLWVPFESGNRTASINLNHEINDFIGCDILVGENGNCCTPYAILPIPAHWTDPFHGNDDDDTTVVMDLARRLCTRLGKTSGYRVLKADARLRSIIEEIVAMAGPEWSSVIYGDVAAIDLVSGEEKLEALIPVNQQMVREVVRIHKASGMPYVTKADATKLRKTLHRYPKDHHFKNQFIGVSFWTQRLERASDGTTYVSDKVPHTRNVEQPTVHYYGVEDGRNKGVAMIGHPTKTITELDRVIAADDVRLREMVEQTFVKGIRVSRPHRPTTTVHTKDEIVALLSTWGLEWNEPSLKKVDHFIAQPKESCGLFLRNSGPVPTILARL